MRMQVGIFVRGRYLFRELNSFVRAHKAQGKPRAAIKDLVVKNDRKSLFGAGYVA